jgi:O-antigen/teichoic acid export membrane protein
VLSLTTGVQTVPVYNTGMRLLTLYGDLMNAIIGGPLLAGFCQVEGSSGLEVLRQKFLQSMRFSVPLAVLGAVGLFAYGPAFLIRWMGPEFAQSGTILRLLIGVFALWLMQLPATSMLLALNRHQVVMKSTLLAGVFNLVVSLLLAWKIGFYGVVIASLIEMAIFYGVLVPYLAARALELSLHSYYRLALLRPLACSLVPSALYVILLQHWLQLEYLRLALLASGLVVVSAMSL